jgi:hypothetical protein
MIRVTEMGNRFHEDFNLMLTQTTAALCTFTVVQSSKTHEHKCSCLNAYVCTKNRNKTFFIYVKQFQVKG